MAFAPASSQHRAMTEISKKMEGSEKLRLFPQGRTLDQVVLVGGATRMPCVQASKPRHTCTCIYIGPCAQEIIVLLPYPDIFGVRVGGSLPEYFLRILARSVNIWYIVSPSAFCVLASRAHPFADAFNWYRHRCLVQGRVTDFS